MTMMIWLAPAYALAQPEQQKVKESTHMTTETQHKHTNRLSNATSQFDIADERSAGQVADLIRGLGYEPVWKDWDTVLTS